MPRTVYEEVMKGKEKMHEDAFVTESLVGESKIKVINKTEEKVTEGLDIGESAALAGFKKEKADALLTDDQKFINRLLREGSLFMTPPTTIVWLAGNGKVTKDEALKSLEKIRVAIREELYESAKSLLGG